MAATIPIAPRILQYSNFLEKINLNPPVRTEIEQRLQYLADQPNVILTVIYQNVFGESKDYVELQLNRETGAISPPIRPNNNMYTVVESYYKHGDVAVKIIDSDKDMRTYCLEELREYESNLNTTYNPNINNYSLDRLITKTIDEGNKVVENEAGSGVRAIVRGNNMILLK